MSGIQAINPSEGAAWRVQIEAMLAALQPLAENTETMKDPLAVQLIAGLANARDAAQAIEVRRKPTLIKVSPLTTKETSGHDSRAAFVGSGPRPAELDAGRPQ